MKWKAKDVQMGPVIRFEPLVWDRMGCDLEGLSGLGKEGGREVGHSHCGRMMHMT